MGEPGGEQLTLVLAPELGSVSTARHAVRRLGADLALPKELVDDAETVVSELVTNGILHARTPLELIVARRPEGLRIEIVDGSPDPPLPTPLEPPALDGLLGDDADAAWLADVFTARITGRGLAIVGALARRWGVDPLPRGKRVWAELGGGADDGASTTPVVTSLTLRRDPELRRVRLTAVPVRLLMASDDRLATLTRDLEVALLDTGTTALRVADVIVTSEVVERFERLVRERREALQPALARGDRVTDLDLSLPASATGTLAEIEELIARVGLGAGGGIAVGSRAPEIAAFDAWYANEVAAQLAGAPPRPCPFASAVRHSDAATTSRREGWSRALLELDDALNVCRSEQEVLRALLGFCAAVLGAMTVSACMLAGDGTTVRIVDAAGYTDDITSHWAAFSLDDDLPASEVIRTDRPVVIRTLRERAERYPRLGEGPGLEEPTTACIPMAAPGVPPIGCLALGFAAAREFSPEELDFLRKVANVAVRHVVAHRAAQDAERARQRTLTVQRATNDLRRGATALELAATACDALVPGIADFAAVHARGDDGAPRLLANRHRDPQMQELLGRVHARWPRDAGGRIGECMASGRPYVFQAAPAEALASVADDAEHLAQLQALDMGSGAVIPIPTATGVFGALSISNTSRRFISHEDLTAATEVARLIGEALNEGGTTEPEAPTAAAPSIVGPGSLGRLALALTGALTAEDVTSSVFRHALRDIGACTVGLWMQGADGHLRLTAGVGQDPDPARITAIAPDSDLPAAEVLRTGQPLAYASRAERDRRWPVLEGQPAPAEGVVTLPLTARDVARGVLTVGFPEPRHLAPADLTALVQVADLCASALDRGSLYDAERQGRELLQFLVDAGAILAASLDAEAVPAIAADLAVPRIADWCIFYAPEGPWLRRRAIRLAGRPDFSASLTGSSIRADADVPVARCYRSGRVEFVDDVPQNVLAASYPGQPLAELWPLAQRHGLVGVVAPVTSRGQTLGVLSVGFVRRAPFPRVQLVQAVAEFAARVGSTLDVAARLHDERAALHGLADALLPRGVLNVPGVEVATRYLPAAGDVCGDWYELVGLPGGDVLFAIGDAAGHGLSAATLMAELRHGARSLAMVEKRPARLLRALALAVEGREAYATAAYFRTDPGSGRTVWASAGHLPPLVVSPSGAARFLPAPSGPPLGSPSGTWRESRLELRRGETLVLYTDGLVERRPAALDDGLRRLRACAEKHAASSVEGLADALLSELEPGREDDACLLVLRLRDA